MKARDVMTAHPSVVLPGDTVSKAAQIMRDRKVGMLPVIDSLWTRNLVGVITDRDIVVRCVSQGDGAVCLVCDHMTRESLTCVDVDADVGDVVACMEAHGLRRIPVLKRDGPMLGVIASTDLVARLRPSRAPGARPAATSPT